MIIYKGNNATAGYLMATKNIPQVFEEFDRAKIKFVQAVSEFSERPGNVEPLDKMQVVGYLRPLLSDPNIAVRNSAAISLGRISSHSQQMAESMIKNEVLPPLVMSLGVQNPIYKKATCFVLKSLAKHSVKLANSVINSGALDQLAVCLEQFDQGVKQSAANVLASVAKHNKELATKVAECGAIPQLVLSMQEPNPSLKKMTALALYQISKHGAELAQLVVDSGAAVVLSQLVTHHDTHLKREVCLCLSSIARHSLQLAEAVVDAQIFPKIFYRLKDMDQIVRKNAATLIKEIVKQSPQMAKLFVKKGGINPVVEFINESKGSSKLPGILALGCISAFDHEIAMVVSSAPSAIQSLKQAIIQVPDDLVKSSSAWTLGMMGGHSPAHAKLMAQNDVLSHLLAIFVFNESTQEIKAQAKRAIKSIIRMCQEVLPLQQLLSDAPPQILKHLVRQLAKNLQRNKELRKAFTMEEGLRKVQSIQAEAGSKLREAIDQLISLFPSDIIQFYSPNYEQVLIKKMA